MGIDTYYFDLSKLTLSRRKHYYVTAMDNGGVYDCKRIDNYISKLEQ